MHGQLVEVPVVCLVLGFYFLAVSSGSYRHARTPNFSVGPGGRGFNREAKCFVAVTLHLQHIAVQLRLYTCECNTWRDALAEFTSWCLMLRVGSSSSQVPEVADFG